MFLIELLGRKLLKKIVLKLRRLNIVYISKMLRSLTKMELFSNLIFTLGRISFVQPIESNLIQPIITQPIY